MRGPENWRGQRVVVIGAGRSGVGAAQLLLHAGAQVTITDLRPAEGLPALAPLRQAGTRMALGGHPESIWEGADVAVLSPGIAPDAPVVEAARGHRVPVVAEIELAWSFVDAPILAITGSNGKTTVTSMVGSVLEAGGRRPAVCGNIGLALSAAVHRRLTGAADYDAYAVELSSFQCEAIVDFHPGYSAILNLTPDHLDRHGSFEAYAAAKLRLVSNCDGDDWLVYNADDRELARRTRRLAVGCVPFASAALDAAPATWSAGGRLWWRAAAGEPEAVVGLSELAVIGRHNHANACAAAALGLLFGVEVGDVAGGLRAFRPLEHRMESCGEVGGVRCVNDSKATNLDSTAAAVGGFDHGLWLILGGRDKGADFEKLRELLPGRVRRVLLIGEAAERIAAALGDAVTVERCGDMETAVDTALAAAAPGDVLLLSPACTSFDQYDNFEARGAHFKRLVEARGASQGGRRRAQGSGPRVGRSRDRATG